MMNKGTLTSSSHTLRKAIIAAAIGNFITWFKYASYGFLAVILGRVFFFPSALHRQVFRQRSPPSVFHF